MAVTRERSYEPLTESITEDADRLRALVSAMLSGTYKEEFYLWDVASLCRTKPEFARQLLELIDRYHRLGQMPAAQHQKIKEKIEHTIAAAAPPAAITPTHDASTEAPFDVPPETPRAAADPTVTAPLPAAEPPAAARANAARPTADATRSAPNVGRTTAEARRDAPGAATGAAADLAPARAPGPVAPSTAAQVAALMAAEHQSAPVGPGTVLRNRYELQALLGYGGMGSVYRALDRYRASLGLPDCCVALKIVSIASSRAGSISALGREFHNAQQLSHPNVVNVYEIDHEGEASFYTMELLEGERLSQLTERIGGPLPTRYALTIIRDIGAAITHAHLRGVVHADLKPHNIFITYGGQVRVLDFGGLSLTPPEPSIDTLTPGNSSGNCGIGAGDRFRTATPAYASCEQLEGQRADSRDDIYALACIAYELLAGRHPYNGKSSLDARAQRLWPKRPPALRAECWRALRRGLALHRKQRPDQIEPWLEQLGIAAAAERLPPSHQLAARTPRGPWLRRLAIAAVLLLALGIALLGIPPQGDLDWRGWLATAQTMLQSGWQAVLSDTDTVGAVTATVPNLASDHSSDAAQNNDAGAAAGATAAPADTHPTAPQASRMAPAARIGPAPVRAPRRVASAQSDGIAARAAMRADAPVVAASDDTSGVEFAALDYTVTDSAPAARLVVRRTGGLSNDVSFIWWTEQDSAKAEVDFAPLGRRIEHIPSGEDNVTIYVPIISNPLRHQASKFYVTLGRLPDAAPGASRGAAIAVPSGRATVTIAGAG